MSKFAKLESHLQRELSALITTLRDPRVPLVVTVEEVHVAGDGRSAEVLVSTLEDEAYDDLLEALNGASGHLQREVAADLNLRYTPRLSFQRGRPQDFDALK